MTITGTRPERKESPGPDPDGRLAAMLAGGAIGAIVGLVIMGLIWAAQDQFGTLLQLAVPAVATVAGGAISVIFTIVRGRRGD